MKLKDGEERKVKAVIAAEIIKVLESYNCNVDESKEILDYTFSSNCVSAKTEDLILLFQLELMEYFSEQEAHAMVTDKNYRFSSIQIECIKKVLGNFTTNYQEFIEKSFRIKF